MSFVFYSRWRRMVQKCGVLVISTAPRTKCPRGLSMKQTAMSASSVPHSERTAAEKREAELHHVIISKIDQVNDNIRLLRLQVSPSKQVKAWLTILAQHSRTLICAPCSTVPTRPMAGCLSPGHPPSRWLHHHINSARCAVVRENWLSRTSSAKIAE